MKRIKFNYIPPTHCNIREEIYQMVEVRLQELINHASFWIAHGELEIDPESFLLDYRELEHQNTIMGQMEVKWDGTKVISLNPTLVSADPECYLWDTFTHEFAHHVVYMLEQRNGEKYKPHGREFIFVCNALGIRGSAFGDWGKEVAEYRERKEMNRLPIYSL